VTYAGEIIHGIYTFLFIPLGKTSALIHDGKWIYKDVPNRIQVTRYHSLAGDPSTLPDALEITSTTDSGMIMGIRHKDYVIEGVQFHPESIASEQGYTLLANFLSWHGGFWKSMNMSANLVRPSKASLSTRLSDVVGSGIALSSISQLNSTNKQNSSILETIRDQRLLDISKLCKLPGHTRYDFERMIAIGLAPTLIDFYQRLIQTASSVAVLAEIKRSSPSKGDINLTMHAPSLAKVYANAGASAISVLTEPKWFKGSVQDMLLVRLALEKIPNRPAVLRKDFILDEYLILEARAYGADSVLLIVALLNDSALASLLEFSRFLGMVPFLYSVLIIFRNL
jgi:anthranilate synthase/indole-3-glycerol phosphate synthase/phosphoribosylanthranilate isomerase